VSFNRTIQTLKIGRLVLEMFEKYWIDQFAGLLNVVGNKKVKEEDSPVAKQVRTALRGR